jgi:hypothetical protein
MDPPSLKLLPSHKASFFAKATKGKTAGQAAFQAELILQYDVMPNSFKKSFILRISLKSRFFHGQAFGLTVPPCFSQEFGNF